MRRLFAVLVLIAAAGPAAAGLYSADDPCPFTITPDGTAEPLPHPVFVNLLLDRFYAGFATDPAQSVSLDWLQPDPDEPEQRATYGGRLNQLVAARWPKANQLRGADLASHAAALIRLKRTTDALNLLRQDRQNVLPRAVLAHLHAELGQWDDAADRLPDDPADPPPGTTAEQFRWQRGVDERAYRRWLKVRQADATAKRKATDPDQTPDALFLSADGTPIRYWESAGEAAKLPADAVAVVQQMLLWAPWDDRLMWTAAEVFAAKGKVREALGVYKMLVEGRRFTGPRLLAGHLDRTAAAVAALPAEAVDPPPDPPPARRLVFGLIDPLTFYLAVVGFAAVLALMLALQVRAAVRRRRRHRP